MTTATNFSIPQVPAFSSTVATATASNRTATPSFGHIPPGYDYYHPAGVYPQPSPGTSIGDRLKAGLQNAFNGKNLRKSFFRSLLLFLVTLPTAAIIPGPQILVIPAGMGIGATLRFLKGVRNPAKVAEKLSNQ